MRILVLNGGSSSIKFSVFEIAGLTAREPALLVDGQVSGIGSDEATLKIAKAETNEATDTDSSVEAGTLDQAVSAALDAALKSMQSPVDVVGHRVVHPGPNLREHCLITPEVLRQLQHAAEFVPLHGPEALLLIRATMQHFPDVPHYACFDTVFHQTMPAEATNCPLPPRYLACGVRRYGFHGLSCESVVRQLQMHGAAAPRMAIAHLGSGCSVTALRDGKSVDTTMGLTPTGGVVMGTRSGDLDPGLVLFLLRQYEATLREATDEIEELLNKQSGVAALSQMPNDFKAIRAAANGGNAEAALALRIFARSVTKAIGSFCWLLGGLDAIVFTGGIGEHDPQTPADVLAELTQMGIELGNGAPRGPKDGIRLISSENSKVQVFTVPAQEDRMIAIHVERMANGHSTPISI